MGTTAPTRTRSPIVFDSDVLIEVLRGSDAARHLFESTPYEGRVLPAVVAIELLRGSRDRSDLRRIRRFLSTDFDAVTHITTEISRRAIGLVERHALAHRIAVGDALIASTALTLHATLATSNARHYDFISGLDIVPFRG